MTGANANLTDDDIIAWVKAHASEVTQTFGHEFEAARDRFKEVSYLCLSKISKCLSG
jgi:hypothetical protein